MSLISGYLLGTNVGSSGSGESIGLVLDRGFVEVETVGFGIVNVALTRYGELR